jgi:N4-(beta-N-acetylglucosaminyl)-L-asparaginase
MQDEGADPLDAAIAAAKIQELDPEDSSVGLGGLPNEDGVVQLDASCMHGRTKRAGAVAALEGIATPSLVARAVMEYTDHVLLVGEGAKRFALDMGFEEQELLTEASRQRWLRWKANRSPDDNWLDHDGDVTLDGTHGTINVCALDSRGDLGSVTTTSGLSWKIPGRAGDSPIIGAGQYCDNRVGAAGGLWCFPGRRDDAAGCNAHRGLSKGPRAHSRDDRGSAPRPAWQTSIRPLLLRRLESGPVRQCDDV